jgi:primosomal protein N' (replication factor Y)
MPLGLGLGQLVKVPLRKKVVEGIVVELSKEKPEGDYDLKEIVEVVGALLSESQINVAKWMAEYYVCSLRAALSPFLPGAKWEKLAQRMKNQELRMKNPHSQFLIPNSPTITLTPRQTAAYKAIQADHRPTLLFGVTGSGKTEIYAALIADAIQAGKSAILLLPEILLTENFIERFERLLPKEAISIMHSRLTPAKRRREWQRIAAGETKLVIGSRSALFSPMQNLGLIIIDEEHEWTYKNEQSPRYHAVKVAEIMAGGIFNIPKLILGSATPSLESWAAAKGGRYQLVELPERYGSASLPTVRIIDLGEVRFGKHYPLSPTLIEAIRERLSKGEQSILFLNRRGFATNLLCRECRYRFEDPETKLPYTVHYRRRHPERSDGTLSRSGVEGPYLLSHHTGEEFPLPSLCPKCGSNSLVELGAGTERVEVLLRELFPSARILRADSDTLKNPEEMRNLLQKMKDGKGDILLGTQSVVKGLDLPGVTLAAVLLADIGLSLPHFRAGERVFQLLTQLAGRSGRRDPGEVIIQTFRPQAMEIALAASHDVRTYLERELTEREKAHYPPDTEMVRFVFSGIDAKERSKTFCEELQKNYSLQTTHYSLSRAPSLFGGGKIWHVFLRGKGLREALRVISLPQAIVDINPIECL